MLLYLFGMLAFSTLSIFVFLDGPNILKNEVVTRYNRFCSLNKLVATRYKGCFQIFVISVQLISKALWLNFLQYINTSVKPIGNNEYELSYVIKGKIYKMIVKPECGPNSVLLVLDENDEDITHVVSPYFAPQICDVTPKSLGYQKVTVELFTGENKTFHTLDTIGIK